MVYFAGMAAGKSYTSEDKKLLRKLGEVIRARRIALGFQSSESFAHAKGIARAQYQRYEAGQNTLFRFDVF